jgi:hypothetical protein
MAISVKNYARWNIQIIWWTFTVSEMKRKIFVIIQLNIFLYLLMGLINSPITQGKNTFKQKTKQCNLYHLNNNKNSVSAIMPTNTRRERIMYIHNFIFNTTNISIIMKCHYKIWLNETLLVLNTSTSLQTTSAAEAHLAERQFSLKEQTLNNAKSLMILRRKSKTKSFQKRAEFKTQVNLNKESGI